MDDSKNIKSIELSSFTTMGMCINTLISIIVGVILFIIITVASGGQAISIALILIPIIVFSTILNSIIHFFGCGFLYNVITKKLNPINISINDEGEITEVRPLSIALVFGIISLIAFIIIFTLVEVIVPSMVSSFLQTLMMTGQTGLAFVLYNLIMLMMSPRIIIALIVASFVFPFLFTLIGSYCYNLISPYINGIVVDLDNTNDLTSIKSIDSTKTALILSVIMLIIGIIVSIIMLIVNSNAGMAALYNIGISFVGTFIIVFLFTYFYNYLVPKLGEVKIKLQKEL